MSIITDIASFIVLLAGGLAVIYGAAAWAGHCYWIATRRAGYARDMRRSVRLGWNTGIPEDGQWVLVREHMPKCGPCRELLGDSATHQWAVMQRRGGMLWSQTGGYGMPIKNLTGWLAVEVSE